MLVWHVVETGGFDTAWTRVTAAGLTARGRAAAQLPEPYWLDYVVHTDSELRTASVQVTAHLRDQTRTADLRRNADGWTIDGIARPDLIDALDVDIGACP